MAGRRKAFKIAVTARAKGDRTAARGGALKSGLNLKARPRGALGFEVRSAGGLGAAWPYIGPGRSASFLPATRLLLVPGRRSCGSTIATAAATTSTRLDIPRLGGALGALKSFAAQIEGRVGGRWAPMLVKGGADLARTSGTRPHPRRLRPQELRRTLPHRVSEASTAAQAQDPAFDRFRRKQLKPPPHGLRLHIVEISLEKQSEHPPGDATFRQGGGFAESPRALRDQNDIRVTHEQEPVLAAR